MATLWLTHTAAGAGTVNVYAYVQAVYLLPYAVLAVPSPPPRSRPRPHRGQRPAGHRHAGPGAAGDPRAVRRAAAVLVAVARPVGSFFTALDRGPRTGAGRRWQRCPDPGGLRARAPGLRRHRAADPRAVRPGPGAHAALAVAGGWLVAALWPLLTLPEDAEPTGTLRSLGVASSAGMTLRRWPLALLVRRPRGVRRRRGVPPHPPARPSPRRRWRAAWGTRSRSTGPGGHRRLAAGRRGGSPWSCWSPTSC